MKLKVVVSILALLLASPSFAQETDLGEIELKVDIDEKKDKKDENSDASNSDSSDSDSSDDETGVVIIEQPKEENIVENDFEVEPLNIELTPMPFLDGITPPPAPPAPVKKAKVRKTKRSKKAELRKQRRKRNREKRERINVKFDSASAGLMTRSDDTGGLFLSSQGLINRSLNPYILNSEDSLSLDGNLVLDPKLRSYALRLRGENIKDRGILFDQYRLSEDQSLDHGHLSREMGLRFNKRFLTIDVSGEAGGLRSASDYYAFGRAKGSITAHGCKNAYALLIKPFIANRVKSEFRKQHGFSTSDKIANRATDEVVSDSTKTRHAICAAIGMNAGLGVALNTDDLGFYNSVGADASLEYRYRLGKIEDGDLKSKRYINAGLFYNYQNETDPTRDDASAHSLTFGGGIKY